MDFSIKLFSALVLSLLLTTHTYATGVPKPILVIGASYAKGQVPFNQGLTSPLFGNAVQDGSYLDLGRQMAAYGSLFFYHIQPIINEAQAGATTFERSGCGPTACDATYWDSYDTQLDRAILRVKNLSDPNKPLNATHVLISMANDCLHPNAFGVPWNSATPCGLAEFNAMADRFIALGQKAIANGLTPIFTKNPAYEDLDLPLFRDKFGFAWVPDEASYYLMRDTLASRITTELPAATYLDVWSSSFNHIGDGIRPDAASVQAAAIAILVSVYF